MNSSSGAFPKRFRILRRMEFRQVYEEGQRRSASLCAIFSRPNGLSETRLGITVSSRVGGAVLRNRIKRRVREVFRRNRLALPGGWDIVINPRKQAAEVAYSRLQKELMRLFPSKPASAFAPQDRAPYGG